MASKKAIEGMDVYIAFEKAIKEVPWDDTETRGVFADWLDEQGEHEEAERQRKFVPAVTFIKGLAERCKYIQNTATVDVNWQWYTIDAVGEEDKEESARYGLAYAELMYFLRKHAEGDMEVPMNWGFDFEEYTDELWDHFETITGLPSPQGEDRLKNPGFWCCGPHNANR